jgi:hypothetical protein
VNEPARVPAGAGWRRLEPARGWGAGCAGPEPARGRPAMPALNRHVVGRLRRP